MKTDKLYDIVKFISLIIAPVCTFVAALVSIWNWNNYGPQIVATISAFDVLCGAIVTIMKTLYDKEQKKLNSGNQEEN